MKKQEQHQAFKLKEFCPLCGPWVAFPPSALFLSIGPWIQSNTWLCWMEAYGLHISPRHWDFVLEWQCRGGRRLTRRLTKCLLVVHMWESHVGTNLRSRSRFFFPPSQLLATAQGLEEGERLRIKWHTNSTQTHTPTHTQSGCHSCPSLHSGNYESTCHVVSFQPPTNNFWSIQISAASIYGSVCPHLTRASKTVKRLAGAADWLLFNRLFEKKF